ALANLVGRGRIEAVSGAQLLDQLTTKLGLLGLFSAPNFDLSQPITSATDHQVVELDALPSATKGIERLTHWRGLGDRMTWMAGGHPMSVAPSTALLPVIVLAASEAGSNNYHPPGQDGEIGTTCEPRPWFSE
ncbi:MAG TPA: hypothetical protein VGX16_06640, partial [Solirubrobacteraceae bacterium]|nr:hypothetical protein [Solirubrobacteraceae bacterium]